MQQSSSWSALSVARPELAEPYRRANATSRAAEDGWATIDEVFGAMPQYRMLFEVLLERPKREDGVEGSAPPAGDVWTTSSTGGFEAYEVKRTLAAQDRNGHCRVGKASGRALRKSRSSLDARIAQAQRAIERARIRLRDLESSR